jgi:transcriptional regulator with XRE-family HTH domain
MPKARATTAYDRYVGERIKEARLAAGLTQEDLANMLGTSYQQVQKYEKGRNRVAGGRIDRMSTALNRPISYFFPNANDVRAVPQLSAFLATKIGQQLINDVPQLFPDEQDWLGDTVTFFLKRRRHD